MSATNSQRVSGGGDSWSFGPTFVNRFAQRKVMERSISTHVSHGRETRHQRRPRVLHTENRTKRFVVAHERVFTCRIAEHASDEVRVHVHETRQQRDVAKIDNFRIRRNVYRSRA